MDNTLIINENNINKMFNHSLTKIIITDINNKINDLIYHKYNFSDITIDNIFYNMYIIEDYDYFCRNYYSLKILDNEKNIDIFQKINNNYKIYPISIISDYIIERDLYWFFGNLINMYNNQYIGKIVKSKATKIIETMHITLADYKQIMTNYREYRKYFEHFIKNKSFMSEFNFINYILMNNDFDFIDNIIDYYLTNNYKKKIINIIEHNYLLKLPVDIYDKFILAFCKFEKINKEELIKNRIYRGYVKPYRLPAIELKKCFIRSCINNYDNKLNLLNIDVINYICNKI